MENIGQFTYNQGQPQIPCLGQNRLRDTVYLAPDNDEEPILVIRMTKMS